MPYSCSVELNSSVHVSSSNYSLDDHWLLSAKVFEIAHDLGARLLHCLAETLRAIPSHDGL